MKNRFNSDDYDDFGNFEEMGDQNHISEEEYEALVAQANALQEVQIQFAQTDLNQRLMMDSIAMLQGSWFWRFKSIKSKLRDIATTYSFLEKLTTSASKAK